MDTPQSPPPADDDLLIIEYVPAFRDATDWRPTFRQRRPGAGGAVIRRVVWEDACDSRRRILVDVTEAPTARDAVVRLAAEEQAMNVPAVRGPIDYSAPGSPPSPPVPPPTPWSQTIRVANLVIWIFSCGGKLFDVTEWKDRIQRELEIEKTANRNSDLVLTPDNQPHDVTGNTYLRYSLEWERGTWAWWKFKASGGTLGKTEDNRLMLKPDVGATEPSVTGWAVEPGRETYWGRYPGPGPS